MIGTLQQDYWEMLMAFGRPVTKVYGKYFILKVLILEENLQRHRYFGHFYGVINPQSYQIS
jgi:hypothetical protein